jgi:hypothetical protein
MPLPTKSLQAIDGHVNFMKHLNPWIFPILWGGIILFLSLLPGGRGQLILFGIPHFDKVGHFGMYAIWAFLLFYALKKNPNHNHRKAFWFSFAVISLIGIILEFGQDTITQGRSFEYADMLANSLGAFAGSVTASRIVRT